MSEDTSNPTDQLVELFVYAPVGLALEAVDNFPKFVERGRSQVTIGRFLARTAAKRGGASIEAVADRVVNDAAQVVVDLFGIDLRVDGDAEPTVQPTADATIVAIDDAELPIPEYDSQAAAQIVKLLPQLDPAELRTIAEHERTGRARVTILRKVEQLLDDA